MQYKVTAGLRLSILVELNLKLLPIYDSLELHHAIMQPLPFVTMKGKCLEFGRWDARE